MNGEAVHGEANQTKVKRLFYGIAMGKSAAGY